LAEVLPHLPEDLLFIQRAADKRVNPIKLFWWKLGERNAQVIERLGVPGSPLKIGEGGSASQILWKLLHKSFCSVRN